MFTIAKIEKPPKVSIISSMEKENVVFTHIYAHIHTYTMEHYSTTKNEMVLTGRDQVQYFVKL